MGAGTTSLPLVAGRARATGEGARLARRVDRRLLLADVIAGGLGAIDVFLLLWLVLPSPDHAFDQTTLLWVNAGVLAVYLVTGGIGGTWLARRAFAPIERWLVEERPATEAERSAVLCQPLVCAGLGASGWAGGAILFALVNLPAGANVALHVGAVILMGGLTCTALSYLLAERIMRPVTARALAAGPVRRPRGPGVVTRLMLAWLLATGVPLAGLAMLGVGLLSDPDVPMRDAALSVIAIAAIGATAGLLATWLVARAIADPLTSVRSALGRLQDGDLDARVTVDDGSEVGLVQSGFNAMAAGLQERERLRDLFGRHVGEDVARAALARDGDGARLGGEVREVAVLFVDLIGSTSLAARRTPRDVVRLLNEFFAVVVDVIGRHDGWVNKFEGDAALAVFGAPTDQDDPAGAALAAARELRRRLHVLPGVDAAIGVSAGPCVAGNVGAEHRFEYTVIGDPVNEAARLCELAKRRDERLLAASVALERARNGEPARWERGEEVVLRGRRRATRVATPATPA